MSALIKELAWLQSMKNHSLNQSWQRLETLSKGCADAGSWNKPWSGNPFLEIMLAKMIIDPNEQVSAKYLYKNLPLERGEVKSAQESSQKNSGNLWCLYKLIPMNLATAKTS